MFSEKENASIKTLEDITEWFKTGHNVAVSINVVMLLFIINPISQIIDGMHLTRTSRNLVTNYCRESVFHHLIIEFDCDDQCIDDNIKDTAKFYQKLDRKKDWLTSFIEKNRHYSVNYEKCSPLEGPLISVNNSENQLNHSVTARGVQGLLQTSILGVLASPVIRQRVFYFSRVSLSRSLEGLNKNVCNFSMVRVNSMS